METCTFLQKSNRDRAILSEPAWWATISQAIGLTGGVDWAQAMSEGHPGYKPEEVREKILQVMNKVGKPHRCDYIKDKLGFKCGKNCGVRAPANLRNDNKPGHNFHLVKAQTLLEEPEENTQWVWDGILPQGGMSLLVAKPKVGKSTLGENLAVAVCRGEFFLGWASLKGPVVYLALEEKKSEIRKKLKALGITDEPLYFHFGLAPQKAMAEINNLISETGARLLIIDTLQKLARVKDLNDYPQVSNTLEPLLGMARELNCHILLTHHAGKSDRTDGDEILGSWGP